MKRQWWQEKVAYQIYPKSFYDSNGDGIGDLQGIIQKLDYLKELGVDILWLCPIFNSPQADQGYDISDYYNIHPDFGNMTDMEELIAEAKKRDMYILMDLVVNHCSDEHEWFQKAIADPDGEYGQYFYIEEVSDGKIPSNWRSYFGGSVWEKLPGHDNKYYMHLFHKKQPDLNWENPKVRSEVQRIVNWWLEKGLGGFRVDAITNIKKALPYKDYPADRADGLCVIQKMLVDAGGPGAFLHELKEKTFKPYHAFTVGEAFDVPEQEMPNFVGDDGYFSTIFNFSTVAIGKSGKGWYDRQAVQPEQYIQALFDAQEGMNKIGFVANIVENHDEPRGASHYLPKGECTEKGKKLLGLLSFMIRGIPFIYQGQEIGMENTTFESLAEIDDIVTYDEYEVARQAGLSEAEALRAVSHYSRDNTRTPMHWEDTENAGFTSGKPWLKVNPNYPRINVSQQRADQNSVFHFYKALIALRKSPEYKETIVFGDFVPNRQVPKDVMAFYRVSDQQKLLVLANFKSAAETIDLPQKLIKVLLNNDPEQSIEEQNGKIHLSGYQAVVLEVDRN
ncbi:alpha-glucosidase [Clostridiales bacterium COT073_COT-073]|nr:alpha-glucosidase [Clostridiales bacterium COT073_COT-073]